MALTRPRSCNSRLSRYTFCRSNHCVQYHVRREFVEQAKALYLVGFMEPWTCERLSNARHEPSLLMSNLRLPMLNLQETKYASASYNKTSWQGIKPHTSNEKLSLSKNILKSGSLPSIGWLAIFWMHFSRLNRRCLTNWSSNRPKVFFSGTGGTTTPGLLLDSVS
jgi:hypothetical protein